MELRRLEHTGQVMMPRQAAAPEQSAQPPMSPDQRRRMVAHRAMEERYMTAIRHGPTAEELAAQKAARAKIEAALASASGGGAVTLANGVTMPLVGFGIADSQETLEVALQAGYRLLDTARMYVRTNTARVHVAI